MSAYLQVQDQLKRSPKTWLVTGAAGFIGSHLVAALLRLDQRVVGLDNFSTGKRKNLEEVKAAAAPESWRRFEMIEGDIAQLDDCVRACRHVDFVLHHAALGSVPASLDDPPAAHRANVTGFLNMILAAREPKIRRFVYASSSAVYGDEPSLPKIEDRIGRPLSPYAATKWMNEIYAGVFTRSYGNPSTIGLRYFNVFGARQDPDGAYAAVIPKWTAALLRREPVYINGDGETSRDFCFVDNVVQANLLAATTSKPAAIDQIYNIAVGERTTLNELFRQLQNGLRRRDRSLPDQKPVHRELRPGDVRHSLADISKARQLLGYEPSHRMWEGLELAMDWYKQNAD